MKVLFFKFPIIPLKNIIRIIFQIKNTTTTFTKKPTISTRRLHTRDETSVENSICIYIYQLNARHNNKATQNTRKIKLIHLFFILSPPYTSHSSFLYRKIFSHKFETFAKTHVPLCTQKIIFLTQLRNVLKIIKDKIKFA